MLSTVYNAAGYPSGRTMTVAGTTTNVSTITGVDDSNRPLTVVSGGVPGSSTSYDSLTTRTFDAEGRPQTIGVTGSHGGALMSMSLQFDPAENLTSRTYQNQNVAAWTESFTYDGLSRLCTALESTATSTAGPTTVGPTKPCPTQPSGFGGASYTSEWQQRGGQKHSLTPLRLHSRRLTRRTVSQFHRSACLMLVGVGRSLPRISGGMRGARKQGFEGGVLLDKVASRSDGSVNKPTRRDTSDRDRNRCPTWPSPT